MALFIKFHHTCCLWRRLYWLFEEELVSDVFAYFDIASGFAEGQDAVEQHVAFVVEFFPEAESAYGYADFHGFSIV